MTDVDVWVPTHRVFADGADCWASPDPSTPALAARLDPGLEVRNVERRGDWMHVECSNGWSAWVDARLMEQLGAAPPPPLPPSPGPEAAFRATHVVPAAGLAAYASHDASVPLVATLDARLPVQVVERWGDWAQIACSNAWTTWVDGRLLEAASSAEAPQAAAHRPASSVPERRRTPLAGALLLLFTSPRSVGQGPLAAISPVTLLGAALVAVGSFPPLLTVEGFASISAWDAPAAFLVSDTPDPSSFKLGVVLIIAVLLTLLPLLTRRPLPPIALLALAAPATNPGVHLIIRKLQSGDLYPSLGAGTFMITAGGFLITFSALWWTWRERRRAFQP